MAFPVSGVLCTWSVLQSVLSMDLLVSIDSQAWGDETISLEVTVDQTFASYRPQVPE